MNISNNILFAAFFAASIGTSSRLEGWFIDLDQFDQKVERKVSQMRESMRSMGKQLKHAFKNSPTTRQLSLETKDNSLRITIPNIEGDIIEAHLDDAQKKLIITAPALKVTIATRRNIIGVELVEEHTIVEKDKDGKESEFVSTSVSRMDQTTQHELLLDQQTIEYDQDSKKLIVIIPMKEEPKGKPVAINKISSKK